MRKIYILIFLLAISSGIYAQNNKTNSKYPFANSAEKLLQTQGKLLIGGYGEVHYNQPLNNGIKYNGILDVHRLVLLFGYRFSKRLEFISELEFEHVKEVFVEQAFMQYRISPAVNIRAGLLLVPMGIINEYHEPTAFNGVERPLLDKYLIPTTWREIGLGIAGTYIPLSLRYQMYILNGFKSYDNGAFLLNGKYGFRKGRQKGAESFITNPDFTAKIEYFGIRGLNIGASTFIGKTQSTLFNGLNPMDINAKMRADSSVVGIQMLGMNFRFSRQGLQLRGQYYFSNVNNSSEYNLYADNQGATGSLAKTMQGWYLEAGYNIFRLLPNSNSRLIPFLRYSKLNTQQSVIPPVIKNPDYNKTIITTGISWFLNKYVVIKSDFQFIKNQSDPKYSTSFNAGFGFMF